MFGPTLPISRETHAGKYRGEGESFKEAMNRVASALTTTPEEFHKFRDALLHMRFMPAGRVQNAMGSTKAVTPYNCYVSGTIEDSFVSGEGSIMNRVHQSAATMRMGGGIGYDFSTLRPRGDTIRKLMSQSSGPVSFMQIFNEVGLVTSSSGHRRGAQMGVMRVDHPDIEHFVHAKQPPREAEPVLEMLGNCKQGSAEWYRWQEVLQKIFKLTGFNVSIGITHQFMECLREGSPFPLVFDRKTYRDIDPGTLWETIMRSTWDWAEPGVLFIDRINDMNNLWYCETIAATNPCGEQPLPPFGACLLGSFNLVKYLIEGVQGYEFDFERFAADIHVVVGAMDNVVDNATYPLYEQEKEAKSKRRMGLGVTGVANAIEAIGYPYGSDGFLAALRKILECLRNESYRASAMLAEERGHFPLYDEEQYLDGRFIQTLPDDIRDLIAQNGIRNSHLTSIAPTGTISLCADNVSSGIEPVFLHEYQRTIQEFERPKTEVVRDYGVAELGVHGKTSEDTTVKEHLAVLALSQEFMDSAVSKTINVPPNTPWDEFKAIYTDAYDMGCKGVTTYQKNGKRAGILRAVADDDTVEEASEPEASCRIDTATGRRECE